ncbi:MAG TPA: hypothetical protein VKV27_07850 [Solirubrobacteraceae bacterium]|nr:hypothetical protein [Solirubrobacteraceae bacterium]
MVINAARGPGRSAFRADDRSLTPYTGLAVSGEVRRGPRLVELIDAELAAAARLAPVRQRRPWLSPSELAVSNVEAQLVGAERFDDLQERARGRPLRRRSSIVASTATRPRR